MTGEQLKQIFDKALDLEAGQSIRIPCSSRTEQDSVRSQLYRERSSYNARLGINAKGVGISRTTLTNAALALTKGSKWYVTLTPTSNVVNITVFDEAGAEEVIPIVTETGSALLPTELSAEQQRTFSLMIEDGYSEEDALAMIKG